MKLDELQERSTGLRRPVRGPLHIETDESGPLAFRDNGLSEQSEYRLALRIEATFWANRAEYATARKIAERAIVASLYRDELRLVAIAMHAVSCGEPAIALQNLADLRNSLTGES